MQHIQRADYWLADLLRHKNGGMTVDEFVSDTALALNVAQTSARSGVIDLDEVADYAKQRVRYCEKNPVRLAMADALINHWMGI